MGFGENGAGRRVAMGFTKDGEPLHGRGDSELRRGRYPYLANMDGVRCRRDHGGRSVQAKTLAAHHDAIHRLIGVEHERSRHVGTGEVEKDIGGDREGEQPTDTDGSQH